jgi:hypothetical protein
MHLQHDLIFHRSLALSLLVACSLVFLPPSQALAQDSKPKRGDSNQSDSTQSGPEEPVPPATRNEAPTLSENSVALGRFALGVTQNFIGIMGVDSSNGSSGNLATRINPGVFFSWEPRLSSTDRFRFESSWQRVTIFQPTNRTLTGDQQNLLSFQLEYIRSFWARLHLMVGGRYEERLLYKAASSSVIAISSQAVPEALVGAHWVLLKGNSTEVGPLVRAAVLLPTRSPSYVTQVGYSVHTGGKLEKKISNKISLFSDLTYRWTTLPANTLTYTQSELKFTIGGSFSL